MIAGEELCFDYGECLNTDGVPFVKTIASTDIPNNQDNRKLCYCGTEKCRIYLPNVNF